MKKLVCAILAVATAVSFASCTITSPANVIKVNGEDISSGTYLIYQFLSYSNAANLAEDSEKNLLKQTIKDLPAEEWIHNETLKTIKNHIYTEKAFTQAGHEFTAEEIASFESQASDVYAQNEKMFTKNGIGKKTYTLLYINARKDAKLLEEFNAKDENIITDDDIKKYTDDNYAHIARFSLPTTDTDGKALTPDHKSKLDAIAKELEAKINGGAELNKETATEFVEKALLAVGREFTETSVDSYFATSFVSSDSAGYYNADQQKAMLSAKVGAATIDSSGDNAFLWGRIKSFPTDEEFEQLKPSITDEMQNKAYEKFVETATVDYTVEEDAKAVSYYSAKKCKLT